MDFRKRQIICSMHDAIHHAFLKLSYLEDFETIDLLVDLFKNLGVEKYVDLSVILREINELLIEDNNTLLGLMAEDGQGSYAVKPIVEYYLELLA